MKAKQILAFLALFTLFTTNAYAGLIYGTISVGSDPLANYNLTITSGDKNWTAKTDERGSYSIKPNINGPCELTLVFQNQPLTHPVYSQDQPVRYDLVVVRNAENQWVLQRR
jgi:hypothetical protein